MSGSQKLDGGQAGRGVPAPRSAASQVLLVNPPDEHAQAVAHTALLPYDGIDTNGIMPVDPFGIKRKLTTPGQIRAARGFLGLSQAELARAAGVSVPTIKRSESDSDQALKVSGEMRARIRAALEQAGIEFTNGDVPGVRLKKPNQP
ncbi:DNA-binding XRE family transcriptional regulator [Inquilinus ginsengisoli]|uniref:helix-turn-helix domain-containing protein n=1 Tax=Inquilinus ginsengisoli TaxID=363840 RepID=UPI003D1CE1B9